jgi:hypothetical protein
MKKIILAVLLMAPAIASFSQANNVTIKGQGVLHNLNLTGSSAPEKQIMGSPYLNVDYMYGKIVLVNGREVKGMLRYNVRTQDFEVVIEKDTLYISEPELVRQVNFAGKIFVYSLAIEEINGQEFLTGGYYEVVAGSGGSAKLLVKHEKKIKESSYASTLGGGGTGIKRYVGEQNFYIKPGEGRAAYRIASSKDLVSPFRENKIGQEQIKKYISRNNINASDVEDLKRFLEYCNQL